MDQTNKSESFLKIDSFGNKTIASSLLLKSDDVIVALENNLYLKGENAFIEDLNFLKKKEKKTILTIYRNGIFFDVLISGSLGCKFISTDSNETKLIAEQFSKKEVFDQSDLNEYIAMRDLTHNYEIICKSKSLAAGLATPFWLAYHKKWWLISLFTVLSFLLLSANFWIFVFGWICVSIYCYIGQHELLISFALLSGKAYSSILCARDMDYVQKIIRELNPKAKFKVSRLGAPVINSEESSSDNIEKNKNQKNKISDSQEALI